MTFRFALMCSLLMPVTAFAQVVATPPSMIAASATATKPANAPITREELPKLIEETLVANPEIMTKVMKSLQEKQQQRAKAETEEGLKKNHDALFKNDDFPSVGPKDADVTLVEFFDYHCGYCKRMIPTLNELLKQDKKVRVIFRDFPILSEDSNLAARAALAVHKVAPAKYFDYHQALMKMSGKFDEKNLTEAAKKLGVDTKKFKTAMDSQEVTDLLTASQDMASELGVRGTPAMVLPDRLVPGAVPLEDLQQLVAEQRTGGGK